MKNIPVYKQFTAAKILVAGDTMLDSYLQGSADRVSPEAPVLILSVCNEHDRLGGAGNVALNIAAWGAKTFLFGITGKDAEGGKVRSLIANSKVYDRLIVSPHILTTRKLRVVSQQQQLVRLDFEKNVRALAPRLTQKLLNSLSSDMLLVLSDYDKGALAQVEEILAYARRKKIYTLVDPKRADFSCYAGANLLTPNYAEFCRAVGGCHDYEAMLQKGRTMIKQLSLQALLVTCGADGMFLILPNRVYNIPAHSREVYDITGAGDTVIATLAAGLSAGMNLLDATELCSFAAGLSVSRMGTSVIGYEEVVQNLTGKAPYLNRETLMKKLKNARANGQKVVFTNGVFDVLHNGHIFYLEQAAKLGDRMLVGINSDDSARRLKGKNRPINDLRARAAVLASLRMVDWVIPFDEPTPKELIALVRPDFLVKGGDYKSKAEVVGSDLVESYGGKVKLMGYLANRSTSSILSKL